MSLRTARRLGSARRPGMPRTSCRCHRHPSGSWRRCRSTVRIRTHTRPEPDEHGPHWGLQGAQPGQGPRVAYYDGALRGPARAAEWRRHATRLPRRPTPSQPPSTPAAPAVTPAAPVFTPFGRTGWFSFRLVLEVPKMVSPMSAAHGQPPARGA
jgi:hypothetical protein